MCRKLIIGLDFDGTLVRYQVPALIQAARSLNIDRYPTVHDYNYSNVPPRLRQEIYKLFKDPDFMLKLRILPNVKSTLTNWSKLGHKIYIITARSYEIRERTRAYIESQFPMVDETYFVDMGASKVELLRQLNIDLWIDDSPIDVAAVLDAGINTYMVSNRSTCYNWEARRLPKVNLVKSIMYVNLH